MRKAILVTTLFMIATLCFMPLRYAQASDDKTTIQDVKQEAQDLISKIKGYTADQHEEAIKQTEQALKKLDNRIEAVETDVYNSWDKMDKAAREKSQTGLKELRKQRIELAEWYGGLKNSSFNAWEELKKGFSDAYQVVVDTWTKIKSQYNWQ